MGDRIRPDSGLTAPERTSRPWEHSGLAGTGMNHHHGDFGISLRTPWMARSMARLILAEWRVPADTIDVAELLISELATNAIRPDLGWTARGAIRVPSITGWLWHIPDLVVIEVSDRNKKPPELQVAEDDSEGGRGLQLVESLSREWGYYYRRGWKTVYCVIGERNEPAGAVMPARTPE
jgi:anti-sigma regulatory factor (Ser/Thr protein kinase)